MDPKQQAEELAIGMNDPDQSHPCEFVGCTNVVAYDDEPYCFVHSPDSGSYVPGYSYRHDHVTK